MKKLLTIDIAIQVMLIFAAVIAFGMQQKQVAFSLFYFGLGGYQLITNYVKLIAGYRSTGRKFYNYCLIICFIGLAASLLVEKTTDDYLIYYGFFMLAAGPLLAFLHLALSIAEVNRQNPGTGIA